MRYLLPFLVPWVVLIAGCGGERPATKSAAPQRFEGTTVRVRVGARSPVKDALELRLAEWNARTGGRAEIVEQGDADLFVLDGQQRFEAAPFPPLPSEVLESATVGFDDFAPRYRLVFCAREDATIALPLAGDGLFLWYRADLFKDPEISASFQAKHGRELAPPATWKEYLEIAEFFFGHDKVKYGTAEAMDDSPDAARHFLAHAAASAKGTRWSSFAIDTETATPLLTRPPFLLALEDWIRVFPFSPAGDPAVEGPIDEEAARRTFLEGNAAMLLSRVPPAVGMPNPEQAAMAKRIDVAPLPGSTRLYAPRADGAEELPAPNRCFHLASTGQYVVMGNKGSPASVHLLEFLFDREGGAYLVQAGRKGLLPAWPNLLAEPEQFRGYGLTPSSTRKLFQLVSESLRSENWVADFRTSNAPALEQSLAKHLRSALEGKVEPAAALRAAANDWSAIIDEGKDAFLKEYRESLGLPALIP